MLVVLQRHVGTLLLNGVVVGGIKYARSVSQASSPMSTTAACAVVWCLPKTEEINEQGPSSMRSR